MLEEIQRALFRANPPPHPPTPPPQEVKSQGIYSPRVSEKAASSVLQQVPAAGRSLLPGPLGVSFGSHCWPEPFKDELRHIQILGIYVSKNPFELGSAQLKMVRSAPSGELGKTLFTGRRRKQSGEITD